MNSVMRALSQMTVPRGYLVGPAVALPIAIGLYFNSDVYRASENFYEPQESSYATDLHFSERAKEFGINSVHTGTIPLLERSSNQDFLNLISGVAPSLAVVDINEDGYLDVYVTQPGIGAKNQLFINHEGKRFEEAADQFGLADVNHKDYSEVALFADLNGDGHDDLVVGRSGCHSVYINKFPRKKFEELKNAMNGYCSNTRGFSFLDYDQDGNLDIYVGNYFPSIDLNKQMPPWVGLLPRGDDKFGGKNALLKGKGDGSFLLDKGFDPPYFNHTFFPGVSDLDKNGWPDIFEGNDFTFDRLYYNDRGKLTEVTRSHLPMNKHGFAGMNSEIFDFDRDGWLDLYVTNIYGPPFSRKGNVLWKGSPSGFSDVSDQMGVRKCGWSWGAKFADFDRDGRPELIVAGGMVRGKDVSGEADGEIYWYRLNQKLSTPLPLKSQLATIINGEKMNYFGYQRGCLFQWSETRKKYIDVAVKAGFEAYVNSRALALFDFNNDGRIDVLTGNYNERVRLFVNESLNKNKWVGLELHRRYSSHSIAIGSRLRVWRQGKLVHYAEIYPGNGHRGQNDPRVVIGLGIEPARLKIEVKWPDGTVEVFNRDLVADEYNTIVEGQGEPSAETI